MDTIEIPLSKLRIDPANVRHPKEGDPALEVHTLQTSLLEHGQRTALEVRPIAKPRGHYAVFAGGRRLIAFQGLAADGRIPADHPIRCDVQKVDDATATELSAVENLERVNLKPTEEFELFARISDQGVSDEDIARRFGITVLHVKQRQQLGRLHPSIFEALDAGQITLDVAKAYASTSDRALQARVFAKLSESWQRGNAYNVRNAIRGGAAGVDADRMLKVVGRDAYVEAGGQIEVDLFTDEVRIVNRGTLEELYYAKLQEQEEALAAKLPKTVTVVTSRTGIGEYIYTAPVIPEDKRDRLTAIDERTEVIEAKLEQLAEHDMDVAEPDEDGLIYPADAPLKAVKLEDQQTVAELQAELDELEAESEAIHGAAEPVLPEGPIVALAEPGPAGMTVKGYYRPAGWVDPAGGAAPARGGGVDSAVATKAETGLSKEGVEVMQSHRRAILRGAICADNIDIGHRFLIFTLARLVLNNRAANARDYHHDYAKDLGVAGSLATTSDPVGANELAEQMGAKAFEYAQATIASSPWMMERDAGSAFERFLQVDEHELEQVAGMLGAAMLSRSLQAPGLKNGMHDTLARALRLDEPAIARRYWSPSAADFDWLPKARRTDLVAEVSPRIAKAIAKKPTADIAAACARFFRADPADVTEFGMIPAEVKYARMWVPSFLRFDESDPPWVVAHASARAQEMAS